MDGFHSLSWLEGYNIRTSAIVNLCECSRSEMIFFCVSVIVVVNVVKKITRYHDLGTKASIFVLHVFGTYAVLLA